MKRIIAIDGGGTKTHLGVFDDRGRLLYETLGKGSNHASSDGRHFDRVLKGLFDDALETLGLVAGDIDYVFLGLSGADLESDFIKLEAACETMFGTIPFRVVNDAWLVLRSGLSKPYGAVAISGTGTNAAAINKEGKRAILRSLGYTLGIYGGGLDIAREGLHYAFRADELTYRDTVLKTTIPALLGVSSMEAVVDLLYPKQKIDKKTYGSITGLVYEAAAKGDPVSVEILTRIATFIARQTAGVMRQVGIDTENAPVVVGGRVFGDEKTPLMNTFRKILKEECPAAHVVRPKFNPMTGAYLSGLDELGIKQDKTIEKNLMESGCGL